MRALVFLFHAAITTTRWKAHCAVYMFMTQIMSRSLFDAMELESFWCSTMQIAKLPETVYKSPSYSSALCNNIFVWIWIFLSASFKNKCQNRWKRSNDLRMALSNCVPRYERRISEKQQQKRH